MSWELCLKSVDEIVLCRLKKQHDFICASASWSGRGSGWPAPSEIVDCRDCFLAACPFGAYKVENARWCVSLRELLHFYVARLSM